MQMMEISLLQSPSFVSLVWIWIAPSLISYYCYVQIKYTCSSSKDKGIHGESRVAVVLLVAFFSTPIMQDACFTTRWSFFNQEHSSWQKLLTCASPSGLIPISVNTGSILAGIRDYYSRQYFVEKKLSSNQS